MFVQQLITGEKKQTSCEEKKAHDLALIKEIFQNNLQLAMYP